MINGWEATDNGSVLWGAIALGLLVVQLPAVAILFSRLLQGPGREQPLRPRDTTHDQLGSVSILVPTLNEVNRLGPCLEGLGLQGYEVREVLVIDSNSQDGTPELVKAAAQTDPRLRLLPDDPLPADWVGRPWALHTGFRHSSELSRWVLGIDADTRPKPGLVAAAIAAAEAGNYDLVSFAPRFVLKTPGELVLQPALLMTLVYRFGPAGTAIGGPTRAMANGQCFLVRRDRLVDLGGYSCAKRSFCDDVTLARFAAARGMKVGFLDGGNLIEVRMYEGAAETWNEWGRSLDLKDASPQAQTIGDCLFLLAVQGLPLPLALLLLEPACATASWLVTAVWGLNVALVAMRFALNWAIAPSYNLSGATLSWLFFLSPLADPLAALRIGLSSVQTPTQWRGRSYSPAVPTNAG
jgi:dolichol-phosphate mannosyltransferase